MEEEIFESVGEVKSSTQLKNELWAKLQDANIEADNKIAGGMIWNGYNVWLSMENQFNFKAVFDLAQQGMPVLPVTFKFGDEFHEFTTLEELTKFYLASVKWAQTCLGECWQNKAMIEAEYNELINEAKAREEASQDNSDIAS